jgi:transcriptional regulator with PAS, ATPase and Fis domain
VLVIAASNRDLPAMIRRGEFRADLFHRLSTLRVHLPPLRDRPEDFDGIVDRTLAQLAAKGYQRELTRQDRDELAEYDWPGNIRQLIKVIKRAVYLDMPIADVIEEEHRLGSLDIAAAPADPMTFLPKMVEDIRPLEEARNAYARRALALHRGNVHATARALQVTDRTLLARLGERPTERAVRIGKAR